MQANRDDKIISADDATEFDIWNPPEVVGNFLNPGLIDDNKSINPSSAVNTAVTAQSVEQIRQAAYLEGKEKGKEDGLVEFRKQQQHIVDTMNSLLVQCQKQIGNFDQQICEQLVTMTISVAKQVIRRELSVEPEQIMAVIRDAINCLPSSSEKLILKLHPDDAVLVRDIYNLDDEPERTWKIFEDPGMQRGGCIINSESSVVNADLDHRIATIVSQLLGGERSDD